MSTVETQNVAEDVDPAGSSQEISAHETVETSPVENARAVSSIGSNISHNILLGRWRLLLDLFGRVFMEDVGLEVGSVVSELGGFQVKEAKFRRDMEKLRNSQQRDITLFKVILFGLQPNTVHTFTTTRIFTAFHNIIYYFISTANGIQYSY